MNSKHLVSALALIFGVVTSVGATQLKQHGASFVPRFGTDAASIVYSPYGVSNSAETTKQVIASVDHNPGTAGETVYVFGWHNGVQTTTVCAYSYNLNGVLLAGICNPAVRVANDWVRAFPFTAAQTPHWSFLSVLATLPASGNGRVLGLSVVP